MSLAPNALTTYAAVSARTSSALTEAAVDQIINEVSEGIEDYLGRKLGYKEFGSGNPEQHQGRNQLWLSLSRRPIYSVQAVVVNGATVTDYSRSEDGDEKGKLYRVTSWPADAPSHPDVTRDPDYTRLGYNIAIQYKGGFILPQYDEALDDDYNPDSLSRNLPYAIEGVAIEAVLSIVSRPLGSMVEETTPGGWRRKWASAMSSAKQRESYAALNHFKRNWFA